jgi:hypothetical protein
MTDQNILLTLDEKGEVKEVRETCIVNNELFVWMHDHTGHELKIYWQGEDYPEVFEVRCNCGERFTVEGMKNLDWTKYNGKNSI